MAFPVDAGRQNNDFGTAADPWTVAVPSGTASGDLLIVYLRAASAVFFNSLSGNASTWNSFGVTTSQDAADDVNYIAWGVATGTDNISVDLSATAKGAAITWRITGATTATAPDIGNTLPDVGTAANLNAQDISLGSAKDYLFLTLLGMDGETAITSGPSGYGNFIESNSGISGAVATNCRIAGSSRQLNTSFETPGTWTSPAPANGVSSWTIAISPILAGGVAQGDQAQPLLMTLSRR